MYDDDVWFVTFCWPSCGRSRVILWSLIVLNEYNVSILINDGIQDVL